MKSKTIRLLKGVLICALLMFIITGCKSPTPDANSKPDDNANTNVNTGDENPSEPPKIDCENKSDEEIVNAIYESLKQDPDLKNQVANIRIKYSDNTVELSGFVYGEENLQKFYSYIFAVQCVKKINHQDLMWHRDEPKNMQCSSGKCDCHGTCISCMQVCPTNAKDGDAK